MNFAIQSNPQAAFLCDRNCRLFVTVVQSEGILYGFRDHRPGLPLIIVTVGRRCRSVAPSPEYTARPLKKVLTIYVSENRIYE